MWDRACRSVSVRTRTALLGTEQRWIRKFHFAWLACSAGNFGPRLKVFYRVVRFSKLGYFVGTRLRPRHESLQHFLT